MSKRATRTSAPSSLGWLDFYLTGIEVEASDALRRAELLVDLREEYRKRVTESSGGHAVAVVDHLIGNPIVTARTVEEQLGVSRPTALRWLDRLARLEIVAEAAPGPRNVRRFVASQILAAIEAD